MRCIRYTPFDAGFLLKQLKGNVGEDPSDNNDSALHRKCFKTVQCYLSNAYEKFEKHSSETLDNILKQVRDFLVSKASLEYNKWLQGIEVVYADLRISDLDTLTTKFESILNELNSLSSDLEKRNDRSTNSDNNASHIDSEDKKEKESLE